MPQTLAQRIKPLPEPADPASVATALDRLKGEDSAAAKLAALAESPDAVGGLLRGVLAGSPFLTELMVRNPAFTIDSLDLAPEESLERLCAAIVAEVAAAPDERSVKAALRQTRAKAALVIALADLGGAWECEQVTAALTRFADTSIAAAVDWLLRDAERAGRLCELDPEQPGRGSGYVVLALGKHGAFEL
ncbi:MAG TPA: bifunctional [glutamine synthetase] adenylyltransferase/[glutamine synthetase]-adenylyl-L-tyrosine phosphorylase, partial [Hyphomicrobiales bacterium]|nr:bifunctional [glutamine synthetase] adenylyltransferase/[glutamine synthetase]-adenylyl-L-tyrosine phosphorylase [Hyphomicrobiales bacterium]